MNRSLAHLHLQRQQRAHLVIGRLTGTAVVHGRVWSTCTNLKADANGKVNIVIGCPTGTSVVK